MLANVLHDWDDTRATGILRDCFRSMTRAGRVLIIERLIPGDRGDAVPVLLSDINMLVITGGQERTNDEYGQLLRSAGLKLSKIQPAGFPCRVSEGLAA